MPQPSQGPRPEDLHITPRGWSTKSTRTATAFKEWLQERGVPVVVVQSDGWIHLRPVSPEDATRLPPLAEKEFARRYGIRLWALFYKLYDPDNDLLGDSGVTAGSGVVAGAET